MNQINFNNEHKEVIGPFLKEPQPDVYVMTSNKIFPLHIHMLGESGYFSKLNFEKTKVHIIEENLDIKSFVFIMERMYGKKQRFPTDCNLIMIIDVLQFLQCRSIIEELCMTIHTNFEEYGFFLALKLGEKLQMDRLLVRCYREILVYNFEHIIINKIDLYDYDEKSFVSILRKHKLLQKEKVIDGIQNSQILKILQEYSEIHNLKINKEELEKNNKEEDIFLEIMQEIKFPTKDLESKILRKRSKTWDVPSLNEKIENDSEDSASTGSPTIKEEIETLTNLNNRMQEKNISLIEEIHEVKSLMSKESDPFTESTLDENELEEKFHQIEIEWEKQEEKYMGIVKKLKTYNECQQKNKGSSLLSHSEITRELSLDSDFEI